MNFPMQRSSPTSSLGVYTKYFILGHADIKLDLERKSMPSYSKHEISEAFKLYDLEGNVTRVVRILGYPTKATLYLWLRQRNPKSSQVTPTLTTDGDRTISNFYLNRKVVSTEIKIEAIKRCFQDGEDVRQVAEEMGVSRQSIHNWRRIVEKNGLVALMNRDKQKIIDKNITENDSNNMYDS